MTDPATGPPERSPGSGPPASASAGVHPAAVAWGLAGQALYVAVLYAVPALAEARWGGAALLAATGLVGGQLAGHVASEHGAAPTRSAAVAAGVGGLALAALVFWTLATPGTLAGAFLGVAYIVVEHAPPVAVAHGWLAIGAIAAGFGVVSATAGTLAARVPQRWDGEVVGRP